MFRLLLALLLAAFLSGTASSPALAQAFCGDRSEIIESLEAQHGETPKAIGLSQDGGLLEVLVSPAGGWTILVTYPKRQTCVVATGRNWESRVIAAGQPA